MPPRIGDMPGAFDYNEPRMAFLHEVTMTEPKDAEESRQERASVAFRVLGSECSACREVVQSDWQFCAHCEARLATSCPACGVALPPAGANHCGHCGLILLKTVDKPQDV
jgi:double zinc ribbon protein